MRCRHISEDCEDYEGRSPCPCVTRVPIRRGVTAKTIDDIPDNGAQQGAVLSVNPARVTPRQALAKLFGEAAD